MGICQTSLLRAVTPALSAAPLAVLLAVFGCGTAAPASAANQGPADVTITVVDDPEQLKDKVNKISLPDASEDSQAAPNPGKDSQSDKSSNSAGEQQRNETAEASHDAASNAQSAAVDAAKSDANDAREQSTEVHNNASSE